MLYIRSEDVAAAWHRLQQVLSAILERAAQFEGALHKRIVGNESVGPNRLHQFMLADQLSGMFYEVLERLIHLGAELDFLFALEDSPLANVEGELAKLVVLGIHLQKCSRPEFMCLGP